MKRDDPEYKGKKMELLAMTIFSILKDRGLLNYRDFADNSDMEYSHLQKIMAGKNNPTFSTLIHIIESLKLNLAEFGKIYEQLDEKTKIAYKEYVIFQKSKKGRKKIDK